MSSMQDFQKEIDEYLKERDWDIRSKPDWIAKSISIEAAELLEIFQFNNLSKEDILADEDLKIKIQEELADVLNYVVEMANVLEVDLMEVARAKLEKVKKKYPVELVKGDDKRYFELKQQHRAQK